MVLPSLGMVVRLEVEAVPPMLLLLLLVPLPMLLLLFVVPVPVLLLLLLLLVSVEFIEPVLALLGMLESIGAVGVDDDIGCCEPPFVVVPDGLVA
jgi:hypothetical protein